MTTRFPVASAVASIMLLSACGGAVTPGLPSEADASTSPPSRDASAATQDSSVIHPDPEADAAPPAFDAGSSSPVAEGFAACPWGVSDGGPPSGPPGRPPIPYPKGCETAADCAIGYHLENCCGQEIALGVDPSVLPEFTRDGGLCGDEHGGLCDCALGGLVAEDGRMSVDPLHHDIVVTCDQGLCKTHVDRDGP